jgi:hypothetical protein
MSSTSASPTLHLQDRHRHQHPADDGDQLHRRPVDLRPDLYTFILENLEKFGALKAIGAKGRELVYMILFMATFTALTGYGLGIGLVTLMIWITRSRLPNYAAMITFWNLGLAFGMVVLIAAISSYVGVRKVLKIEPFDIFRGASWEVDLWGRIRNSVKASSYGSAGHPRRLRKRAPYGAGGSGSRLFPASLAG